MLHTLLEELEKSNPRECAVLKELESLDNSLDELLISQNNSVNLDTSEKPPRVCLHIYNTYNKPEGESNDYGYLHALPWLFTLCIRGYEVDNDGGMVAASEPGVLSRYFRHILVCTKDRTVMWDRDGILEYHSTAKNYAKGWRPVPSTTMMMSSSATQNPYGGDSYCRDSQTSESEEESIVHNSNYKAPTNRKGGDEEFTRFTAAGVPFTSRGYRSSDATAGDGEGKGNKMTMPNMINMNKRHDYNGKNEKANDSNDWRMGMDGRGCDPIPFNGYDELHVTQICSGPGEVTLYLFPDQHSSVCTVSDDLHDFLTFANNGIPIADPSRQVSMHRLMGSIVSYAFQKHLLFQKVQGSFCTMDRELAKLFDLQEGSSLALHEISINLKPHISPPKPIKITHNLVVTGDASLGDSFVEVQLANKANVNGNVIMTDYDKEIEGLVTELRDVLHVRNVYDLYADDPLKFINFVLNDHSADNIKPINQECLKDQEAVMEPWIPRAIDKYMSWRDRPVFQLLYGSLNNFMTEDIYECKEPISNTTKQPATIESTSDKPRKTAKPKSNASLHLYGMYGKRKGKVDNTVKSVSGDGSLDKYPAVNVDKVDSHHIIMGTQLAYGTDRQTHSSKVFDENIADTDVAFASPYGADASTYSNLKEKGATRGYNELDYLEKAKAALLNAGKKPSSMEQSDYQGSRIDTYSSQSYGDSFQVEGRTAVEPKVVIDSNAYIPFGTLDTKVDAMNIADGVPQVVSIVESPDSVPANNNMYMGNMHLDHCFSRETHLDLREHLVEEGSKTIEGDMNIFHKNSIEKSSSHPHDFFEKLYSRKYRPKEQSYPYKQGEHSIQKGFQGSHKRIMQGFNSQEYRNNYVLDAARYRDNVGREDAASSVEAVSAPGKGTMDNGYAVPNQNVFGENPQLVSAKSAGDGNAEGVLSDEDNISI